MSIKLAILGILSWKPCTGYDLKKIIEDSSAMYWSGNNNQIYKSLVQLLQEGFVTHEVQHQVSSPSKKIYTITTDGLAELKNGVYAAPELPVLKNSFLTQLAWADQLQPEELDDLLSRYENEIEIQIRLQQEKRKRGLFSPERNTREAYLWKSIEENILSMYEHERTWVQNIRKTLGPPSPEEVSKMNDRVINHPDGTYLSCLTTDSPLHSEQDAADLVAACFENNTKLLMIHDAVLAKDFFKLKTGVAGMMLQKLMNDQIKTALILTNEKLNKGKFKELVKESNKGTHFRVYSSVAEAETWLLSST